MGRKRWALGEGLGVAGIGLGLAVAVGAAVGAAVAVAGTAVGASVGAASVGKAANVTMIVGVAVGETAAGLEGSARAVGRRVGVGGDVGEEVSVGVGVYVQLVVVMGEGRAVFVALGGWAVAPAVLEAIRTASVAEGGIEDENLGAPQPTNTNPASESNTALMAHRL